MNLATRCSTCGTLFRVVQDQLKVSDGWVRCGHCQAVFSALESLFDLEHELLPGESPEAAAARHHADRQGQAQAQAPAQTPASPARSRVDEPPSPGAARMPPGGTMSFDSGRDASPIQDTQRPVRDLEPPTVAPGASPVGPGPAPRPLGLRHADPDRAPPAVSLGSGAGAAAVRPRSFASSRRRPAAWLALALGLVALLGAQAALHARDRLAAHWPALRPALAGGCSVLACRIGLPRAIDELVVENTGLVKTALPGAFKLAVGLRGRGTVALAVPSVEVSLTDTRGELIARRVLAPNDFDQAPDAIRPGTDTVLQALLATPDSVVSGYTVEIFYP